MADIAAGGRRRDVDYRRLFDTGRRSSPDTDRRRRSDNGCRSPPNTNRRGRRSSPDADRRGGRRSSPDTDRRGRRSSPNADRRGRLNGRDLSSSNYVDRSHSEHDNFTSRPNIIPKRRSYPYHQNYNQNVSFKPYNRGNKTICKSYLVQNQFNGGFPKYNTPPKNNFNQRNHIHGGYRNVKNSSFIINKSITGWYSIIVTNAEEFDEVLKKIELEISPLLFYPYNKQYSSDNVLRFLVDDYKVAIALHNTSFKITLRDDRKLIIKVLPYLPKRRLISFTPVSSEVREKMIEAVATRYNPSTKSLDLSKFHAYSLFTNNQLFVPLNQPAILLAALNMAAQHTKHDLYCLSLANNHIYLGEGLTWIRRLFPELKVLDLAANKLSDLNELKSLLGYTIEVLTLFRNPVCDSMVKECYRRDVQKLFPMLIKLDNLNLPLTNEGSKLKMPINLGNSYPIQQYSSNLVQSNPVMTLVELFLAKYYDQYDNKVSRQTVLEAYHENATFSLSSCLLKSCNHGSLTNYMPESRNFLKPDQNINCFLHKGKANIMNILEKLPKTKHDFGSFIIDVPFASSTIIQVVVNGVFAEEFNENHNCQVFRSFSRTFSLVPAVNCWIILSDMMFITLVSSELMEESTKRFYVFKPSITNHTSNSNSFKTTMLIEDTLPDVLSTLCCKTTISNHPSSEYQKDSLLSNNVSPLIPTRNSEEKSTFHASVVQNLQSSRQQQHCLATPLTMITDSILSNSQQLNLPCLVPSEKLSIPVFDTKPTEPELSTIPTKMISNSSNELLMIKRFSNESGMNDKWSKKCLVENNWDFAKATLCFSKLKSRIPSIAYKH
ncbi:nuclear RNA export factor 1-like [Rhopalosiphum padi]|uniref:nuclear RNA export factor 1-like n=1 Tax=Rhopalosiphum padi TaxID=40932 RepID=UPI00298E6B1D|nr:nuclear RNA export factor 1-like [Rhopalosiphum padi]